MPILICIISAFFWAMFDLTRKLSLKKINSVNLLLIFTLAQFLIFLVWIFMDDFSINFTPYFLPGIILIFIGLFSELLLLKAIKQSDLSLTRPLLSFSPMFSSIFSFFFFKWAIIKNSILRCFFNNFWNSHSLLKKINIWWYSKEFQNYIKK